MARYFFRANVLLNSISDEGEDIVNKNRNLLTVESQRKTCAAKKASTLVQSRRPGRGSRSVHSGFDVTPSTLPRFPMHGHKTFKTWFRQDIENQGFNQLKKIL